jgi:hypothetical protein
MFPDSKHPILGLHLVVETRAIPVLRFFHPLRDRTRCRERDLWASMKAAVSFAPRAERLELSFSISI